MNEFNENSYENIVMDLLENQLGYERVYGPTIDRNNDYENPLQVDVLEESLQKINPKLPPEALANALEKIVNIPSGALVQRNQLFTDYLQNGIDVNFFSNGQEQSAHVNLIDYQNVDRNRFQAVNQWTVVEHSERRADIVLFVNGLPLVVVELKSPSREETDASHAYRQLKMYMREIPSLFVYNAICVMSDMTVTKAGTITSGEDRYMEWKSVNGETTTEISYTTLFTGLFEKNRFLDILKNFICFNEDSAHTYKILAGYHQYFAVKKAVSSTCKATKTDGKGGVFWHTQGSGKSLSMVFYAHYLQSVLDSPTIVVITDRNDLDNQLFGQFSRCKKFLRQLPVQAKSRKNLSELLDNREANGIFFTTMQKFEEKDEPLSQRKNIVVMADEAHRSQYGLIEKAVYKKDSQGNQSVHIVTGSARIIRNSLPHATFIGFTGTPVSSKDRNTREVFGEYIDIYDMTQAVADGATRPVYYESRVVKLKLDENVLQKIDEQYDLLAQNADEYAIEKSKHELGQMEAILGAEQTIKALVDDILDHYEHYREGLLTGKAMIVAYSRDIALKIYHRILSLRPTWTDKVAVVMTQNPNDPEEWSKIIGNKTHKEELAREFKDNDSPLKIAIVVDMWLTGFDVPSLATMYVYKPMSGHNLMQAIARVNRVFQDKEGGLVVDYVGIASALKQAMNDYTVRDKKNYGEMDIAKTAYLHFRERLSICRDLIYGFNYSEFMTGTDSIRGELIMGAINFILAKEVQENDKDEKLRTKTIFIKEALALKQAASLCGSLIDQKHRYEAAFFETVRIGLVRLAMGGSDRKFSLTEINHQINELLKNSIKSQGVINLFSDKNEQFSLFDPEFLAQIARMPQRNLAIELIKRLIADQISSYKRTNLVKSEKFSEILKQTMNRYLNGALTNEQVIEELLQLANDIVTGTNQGQALGLTTEEQAFYDALTKPSAIIDCYEHETLINLTRELTDMLRKSRTIDWQHKASARADMRRLVKRLLKKYKYPPEGMEEASKTVIEQCEMWTDNAPMTNAV